MKIIKYIISLVVFLLLVQVITYYTLSTELLVKELGKNYETVLLSENLNNIFDEYIIVSNFIKDENQFKTNFTLFKDKEIRFCSEIQYCTKSISENFYKYYFYNETKNPIMINKVIEAEIPEGFVAVWESKYIWVIFKWILLEKEMALIS